MCSCDLLSFLVLGLSECLQNRRVRLCILSKTSISMARHGLARNDKIEIAHVHIKIDAKTTKIHTLTSENAYILSWALEMETTFGSVENITETSTQSMQ